MDAFAELMGALVKYWWALAGGPAIGLAAWLWERITGAKILPNRVIWTLVVASIVLAFFLAYLEKHTEVVTLKNTITGLQSKLESLSKPSLHGEIKQIGITPSAFPNEVRVIIVASISNTAMDSFVDGWQLRAHLPDGRVVDATRRHAMLGEKQVFPWGEMELVYEPEDALFNKVPIKKGDQITGVMSFGFSGIPFELLMQAQTRFVFLFKDVIGQQYSTPPLQSTGTRVEPQYFPGTHPTPRKKTEEPRR